MILLLDCYDSFTYNLASLVRKATDHEVTVCHHDSLSREDLLAILPSVEGVVIGPGPGHPLNPKDYGVIPVLWEEGVTTVPILGICFGYQSMVTAYGGNIERLEHPKHGQVSGIRHSDTGLFAGIPPHYEVVRYHSLHTFTTKSDDEIEILAWADDDEVEMAAKVRGKPYWGVQFHPESVLSSFGERLVKNWWGLASDFNRNRTIAPFKPLAAAAKLLPTPRVAKNLPKKTPVVVKIEQKMDAIELASSLKSLGQEIVMLHSAAVPGSFSIIGILSPKTWHIRSKGSRVMEGPLRSKPVHTYDADEKDAWQVMADFMAPRMTTAHKDIPFVGGMVGYVTYEEGCAKYLGRSREGGAANDASFVHIEDAIVVSPDAVYLVGAATLPHLQKSDPLPPLPKATVSIPGPDKYTENILKCDEYLRAGDSYELCYTDEAVVALEDKSLEPWTLFKQLVVQNPAPYCTFMDIEDTLVGTSPERFMSWSADTNVCQFRPIKGTVARSTGISYEAAEQTLKTPKERGENLMIVDLIRHDLGHLLGGHVTTPQIMQIEEYKHVYQLVSVIEASMDSSEYSGIDVLAETLPPGSMTGAPKLRSVQILDTLEQRARGLYSGVSGYWSYSDQGDWSVIIRSLFRYGGDDVWRAGAGGAITVLSTPEGEYDEMLVKLRGVMRVFDLDQSI